MKITAIRILSLLVVATPSGKLPAQPIVDSWFTANSGRYARIYTTDANKAAGNAVTTWSNGSQTQGTPAYSGVQEIYSSTNWVYLRTTGLGSHVMGPWYLNATRTQIFPNYPVNKRVLYRIPRTPTLPTNKTLTGLGAIGYFVDGISMFDSRDGFAWTGSGESGGGTGYWNRDAYVNEGVTLDPGLAHQEQSGTHHYHANPIALRYLLGDHVDYNPTTKSYSESTNPVTAHSPILGWVRDGHPVYGPYGYAEATNAASSVRRMISGYVLRNGQNGTDSPANTGRSTIPAWAVRLYNVSANQAGPATNTYPLGRYMEDNAYLGDLGYTQGTDFDLDEYNGRWCVTPDFPEGVYAYFVSVSSNGVPTFPYNIGRAFHGSPTGSAQTSINESVTTNFLGESNLAPKLKTLAAGSSVVTLTWSALEGGTYRVESTTDFSTWTTNATNIAAALNTGTYSNSVSGDASFYRVARTVLASYDSAGGTSGGGGGNTSFAPGGSASAGTSVTVTITLPTTPMQPPVDVQPASVTLAGTIPGTSLSRPAQGTVIATFAIPASGAPTGLQNIVVIFPGPTYTLPGAFTINP